MLAIFALILSFTILSTARTATYSPAVVSLDYGSFQGAYNSNLNISYFRKIPFAAPPIGTNRFRAPQPVATLSAMYNTNQDSDACPQKGGSVGSEDCLYLGLYSRPWNSGQPLRPVMVNFYGGGFVQGGGAMSIPPTQYPVLNVSASNNFVVVQPNYRVNAFGFLPGQAVSDDANSDLNAGLLDQQAALKWVNKYVLLFGGDPQNVTIWGQSAGGGSVIAQVIANNGATSPKLFTKALASSPFWPKTFKYNAPESEAIFNTLANLTGCQSSSSSTILQCLKTIDVGTLNNASLQITQSRQNTTGEFTWAPVLGGSFLTQSLTTAVSNRAFNSDYNFNIFNSHEGETFVHSDVNVTSWLSQFLPKLSAQNQSTVLALYPESGSTETFTYSASETNLRAGLIYRDTVLSCPAYWIAQNAKKAGYLAELIIDPAKHGSDTQFYNRVNSALINYPITYKGFTGAFASYIQTGDPNAHKLLGPNMSGPTQFTPSGQEWLIGDSTFSSVKIVQLAQRCAFWMTMKKVLE